MRCWHGSWIVVGALVAALGVPSVASADCTIPNDPVLDPPDPTFGAAQDFDGTLDASLQGSYIQVPFTVPAGTTAIRIRYCYDQPPSGGGNTLDMGVYEPLHSGDTVFGPNERRGWSGSAVKDLAISVNGFSPAVTYEEHRKAFVHPYTTRAYQPGAIPAGEWAAELGLASIAGPPGDPNGIDWRIRVETSISPQWSSDPYTPATYSGGAVNPASGWYAGDVHVHGEQEPGNALMRTSFDYGFKSLAEGGAGLDFIGLVDHNNDVNVGEIGRYEADYPGKLIIPGTEVTTYKGHYNDIGSGAFADFRGGPVYGWDQSGGTTTRVQDPVTPVSQFGPIEATGGWTQINHPTTFPSNAPGNASLCRGCPWDYPDAETDFSKVDAIEVQNGPADIGTTQNPFTLPAIAYYEHALSTGAHVAAVGSSDSHQADETNVTTAPIGRATTVVGASSLSEAAIVDGLRNDHTYVKLYGNDGPDIRVTATAPGELAKTIGDTLVGPELGFTVRVTHAGPTAARPGPYELRMLRDGVAVSTAPIPGDDVTQQFGIEDLTGRYSFEVVRDPGGANRIEVYSSPVWYENAPAFKLGKLRRDKRKGTAKIAVEGLRYPGELKINGDGLRKRFKSADPGSAKLKIKPKGKLKKRLAEKGKAKTTIRVSYTPLGGSRAKVNERVKLKRKLHGGHR